MIAMVTSAFVLSLVVSIAMAQNNTTDQWKCIKLGDTCTWEPCCSPGLCLDVHNTQTCFAASLCAQLMPSSWLTLWSLVSVIGAYWLVSIRPDLV